MISNLTRALPRVRAADKPATPAVIYYAPARASFGRIGGLVAQGAAQDLADVGFRQFVAEFDVARHLVGGEPFGEKRAQLFFGDVGIFLDREQLGRLAGILVRHVDGRAFEQPAMSHRQVFDFVREHL